MAKILFINGSDPWTQASGYFLYSARALQIISRTHDVTAASLYGIKPQKLSVPDSIKRTWFAEKRLSSVAQRLKSMAGARSFCEREFDYPGVVAWARDIIQEEKPTLVVFNHIRAAWLAPLLGRLPVPSLYLAHNAESLAYASIARLEGNPAGKLFAYLESKKLLRLEQRILRSVDSCIALTDEDKERLRALAPELPIQVVPPCFDLPAASPPAGEPRPILIVGSFHWRPKRTNVLWFLRHVYAPLRQADPSLRCVIVGANANALRPRLAGMDGISLHADVPSVSPFLSRASVFVTPERQQGGIKLKTCEAAAYGQAIVSTTPGMEGTGLRDQESCLVANTADEMQAAVRRCLREEGFALALGQRARLTAQARFSPEAVADKLNTAIDAARTGRPS